MKDGKEARIMIKQVIKKQYSGRIRVYRNNSQFTYEEYEGWSLVPQDVKDWVKQNGFKQVFGF